MVARPGRDASASPRLVKPGNRLDTKSTEAWPEGSTYTIQVVAALFGKKPKTIYNLLWEQAKQLSRPKYYQLHRGKGDLRYYRILTEADILVIRQCFPVRVK